MTQDKQKLSTWLMFHPKSFSVCCWWELQRFIKASVKSVSGGFNCFYHTGNIEKEPIFDRFLCHKTRHLISLSWYVACLIAWCVFTMVFVLKLLNTQKSCVDQDQIIVVCNIFSVNKWKWTFMYVTLLHNCLCVCVLKSDPRNERMQEISHVDPWNICF